MKFGRVSLDEARGAILAHTVRWEAGAVRKGRVLDEEVIRRLRSGGIREVVAAHAEPGDTSENEVSERIAAALVPEPDAQQLRRARPGAGRANIFAAANGVLRVRKDVVYALNAIDESITLATLADHARVRAGSMAATVKIIPYSVPESTVGEAESILRANPPAIAVAPVEVRNAALLLTRSEWTPEKLGQKGVDAVRTRLNALGVPLFETRTVPHEVKPLASALAESTAELVLILGDSATSDRNDVAPEAIRGAGGGIVRFGMPVDPGNLLLLASLGDGRQVMVLPGCVRSPKMNGADWVLERIACGIEVSSEDIAGMGVGGLLHEIPLRPAPRVGGTIAPSDPNVSVLLLAAGLSRRMKGAHKLLIDAGGQPLASRVTTSLKGSRVREIIAVTGHKADLVEQAISASGVTGIRFLRNANYAEGIGASIRAGMGALSSETDAVLIALADMPGVDAHLVDRLIGEFDPEKDRAICRPVAPGGAPGHPVLFGRRFFEALEALGGDRGARDVVGENSGYVVDIPVDASAAIDLDTESDWAIWRSSMGL